MDLNVRAFRTVQQATSETAVDDIKRVASRAGGRKGGPARAKALTAARRREIALRANRARWGKSEQ